MDTQEDTRLEGVTDFGSSTGTTYRHNILLRRDTLRIWLEDRSSKRQWKTTYMQKDDYVTSANAFVDATSADYASLFKQSLECPLHEAGDIQRKLTHLQDDALRLEFRTAIRLLNSSRSIRYAFDLQSVAVDRIQILEAKMRDHQEALDQVGAGNGTRLLCQVRLSAESDFQLCESRLMWKSIENDSFALVDTKRNVIQARVPGLYALAVVANHVPRDRGSGGFISLLVNGAVIQRAATGVACIDTAGARNNTTCTARHHTSSSLMCLARVKKDARISVIFTRTALAKDFASYLTAVRILE